MAGKRKIPAQRAIELAAIMADCSLEEVNKMLDSAGFRDMNETSYIMVKKQYVPFLVSAGDSYTRKKNSTNIREHLYSPRRLNQLKQNE